MTYRSEPSPIQSIGMTLFAVLVIAFSIWANIAWHKWIVRQAIEESRQEAKE